MRERCTAIENRSRIVRPVAHRSAKAQIHLTAIRARSNAGQRAYGVVNAAEG